MNRAKIWQGSKPPKVLVIGHDPRLRNSLTEPEYCFFTDYYFKENLTKKNEIAKYELAKAVFHYISYITSNRFSIQEYLFTNLCNQYLPPAPKGRTVYIPEEIAKNGIEEIKEILRINKIEMIFAMSNQVNYWLQKLGLCNTEEEYLKGAAPIEKGINNNPPYYNARKLGVFQMICGKKFFADNKVPLFPVLHVKCWPLKGILKEKYEEHYIQLINEIEKQII